MQIRDRIIGFVKGIRPLTLWLMFRRRNTWYIVQGLEFMTRKALKIVEGVRQRFPCQVDAGLPIWNSGAVWLEGGA